MPKIKTSSQECIFMHCELLLSLPNTFEGYNGQFLSVYNYEDDYSNHEREFLINAGCFGNYYVYSFTPDDDIKLVYSWAFDETCTDAGLKPLSTEKLAQLITKEYNIATKK